MHPVDEVTLSVVKCHLKSLIDIADGEIPPTINRAPDVDALTYDQAISILNAYRDFLRSPRRNP